MSNKMTGLIRVLASQGNEEQLYAITIAFNAARVLVEKDKAEFERRFGTVGAEIVTEFTTNDKFPETAAR